MDYLERRLTRHPEAEEFGQGATEGVAGPEAANNAAAAGVLVPLLTLGLPTSAAVAILLALFGLIGYGMRRFAFPVTPAIIGVVLGPSTESQFRTALQQSNGDFSIFVRQLLTAALLLIVVAALVVPVLLRLRHRPA